MELIRGTDADNACIDSFEKALIIWIRKPHVANRRLCGSEVVFETKLTTKQSIDEFYFKDILSSIIPAAIANKGFLINLACKKFESIKYLFDTEFDNSNDTAIHVLLRHLISKNSKVRGAYELVIQRKSTALPCAYFLTLCEDESENSEGCDCYAYELAFHVERKRIELHCHKDYISNNIQESSTQERASDDTRSGTIFPSVSWLSDTLLRKLTTWSQEKDLDTSIKSLRLINLGRYNDKYSELKEKYAKSLVDMWTESTDPLKFVYEDIGIAAYLLVLWESLDDKCNGESFKKSKVFVDLGCGNGLLVYLLNSEGHHGYGVDIRKRRIWETLKPTADLREFAVLPSEEDQFPDAEWLIGNHSDELTPWIPVMAARSKNRTCQYFVLPCCPWDFTCKFTSSGKMTPSRSTQNSGVVGKYGEYLNFVHDVGKICGFKVEKDTLRIPSTRRVCFIGIRDEEQSDENRLKAIQSFIESRCLVHQEQTSQKRSRTDLPTSLGGDAIQQIKKSKPETGGFEVGRQVEFVPRSASEAIRHTLKLDSSFTEEICVRVMKHLLKVEENYVNMTGTDDDARKSWNKGGKVPLPEICSFFDEEQLKNLKSSCGGLQTVLKNCTDVFSVRGGEVSLRDWSSQEFAEFLQHRKAKRPQNKKSSKRSKTKICFFYQHHPDGCLLARNLCRFAHGPDDMSQFQ